VIDWLESLSPWPKDGFGTERMVALLERLGNPQRSFEAVHVVGTKGKSTAARRIAATIGGLAYTSPHVSGWHERLQTDEAGFERAIQRVRPAAEELGATQFEILTAAALAEFAAAEVDVAVVEAGLGGRLDATNTIPSRVTVLTSIGLDHTEWLGETELEIAAEKLAVLHDQSILVLGRVSEEVRALAERVAGERSATLIVAPEDPGPEVELAASGPFQRRNFALAVAAAEAFLGSVDRERVATVAAGLIVPGRLELIADSPPTYVDAAHNPDGAAALAEALPALADGRPIVACLAMLADKDAPAMIAALAPVLRAAVCTEIPPQALIGHGRPGARSRPAQELADLCQAHGLEATAEPNLEPALRRATELACGTTAGLLLVTGSHYLIGPARATQGALS
jgi:dihydrofolate synthase/folylpolyglutamate synthase